MKSYDSNPQVIYRKIRKFENEIDVFRNILKETKDKEFYIKKIQLRKSLIYQLSNTLENVHSPHNTILIQLEEALKNTGLISNECFQQIFMTGIEMVIVKSKDTLRI